jgi:hypothetical protein
MGNRSFQSATLPETRRPAGGLRRAGSGWPVSLPSAWLCVSAEGGAGKGGGVIASGAHPPARAGQQSATRQPHHRPAAGKATAQRGLLQRASNWPMRCDGKRVQTNTKQPANATQRRSSEAAEGNAGNRSENAEAGRGSRNNIGRRANWASNPSDHPQPRLHT